jgi:hypothetical protein
MPRRYTRTETAMFQTRDVPVPEFPTGEGPPVYITVRGPNWTRLPPGQGVLVTHAGGHGGAYGWGLVRTVVAVWVHLPVGAPGVSYCHHLPPGRLTPGLHERACEAIGWSARREASALWVVLGSHLVGTEAYENAFLSLGVPHERLLVYANASVPQFGVSVRGCVGEAF